MKKLYAFLTVASLCFLFAACAVSRQGFNFSPTVTDRGGAVVDINEFTRSTIELPEPEAGTAPTYFEVVAIGTTAITEVENTKKPTPVVVPPPPPKEYFTVKFVDIDGFSSISVQNVEKGANAVEPPMPDKRDDLIFIGWDKDFTNVKESIIVKAIYQKEWLTVRFIDLDGTVLKSELVFYGEDATPPAVEAPDGYLFSNWSRSYKNITHDIDIYTRYTVKETRSFTRLADAYDILPVTENTLGLPVTAYYRKEHTGVCTIKGTDYAGNILYGNFSDTLNIAGYGFTSFEGFLGMKSLGNNVNNTTYSLNLYIYFDGELEYYTSLTEPDTLKEFSLDLAGVNEITIRLEPYENDSLYYIDAEFVGGIIDAVLYEN